LEIIDLPYKIKSPSVVCGILELSGAIHGSSETAFDGAAAGFMFSVGEGLRVNIMIAIVPADNMSNAIAILRNIVEPI
jgi:hypothetical protein